MNIYNLFCSPDIKSISPVGVLTGQLLQGEYMENVIVEEVKRGRGRPAGSINRPKEVIAAEKAAAEQKRADRLARRLAAAPVSVVNPQ